MGRSVAVYWFRLERIFQSIKLEHVVLLCDVWFRLERIFQSIKLAAELVCQ